ncbi:MULTISPECIES: hypothetical protein [Paenibacillus]|uniref:hypothetical protein n=1 Tax=Paenibacillus TaxID=44249 RepID=UPI00096E0136|nr:MULTISPECIES: hypothetical protein [Paenibacillus]OMF38167.1 hypothetical protein BK135_26610 [Paenibacillus peoriae]QYK62537.1 hypothetical protein KAI37_02867 [Paenibacillus sp. S25]
MVHSYAYLDNTGILHLHPLESEAAKHGKYVGTNLDCDESGFPVIGGEGVVYYVDKDTAYVNGNKHDGKQIAVPSGLKALAGQLL